MPSWTARWPSQTRRRPSGPSSTVRSTAPRRRRIAGDVEWQGQRQGPARRRRNSLGPGPDRSASQARPQGIRHPRSGQPAPDHPVRRLGRGREESPLGGGQPDVDRGSAGRRPEPSRPPGRLLRDLPPLPADQRARGAGPDDAQGDDRQRRRCGATWRISGKSGPTCSPRRWSRGSRSSIPSPGPSSAVATSARMSSGPSAPTGGWSIARQDAALLDPVPDDQAPRLRPDCRPQAPTTRSLPSEAQVGLPVVRRADKFGRGSDQGASLNARLGGSRRDLDRDRQVSQAQGQSQGFRPGRHQAQLQPVGRSGGRPIRNQLRPGPGPRSGVDTQVAAGSTDRRDSPDRGGWRRASRSDQREPAPVGHAKHARKGERSNPGRGRNRLSRPIGPNPRPRDVLRPVDHAAGVRFQLDFATGRP